MAHRPLQASFDDLRKQVTGLVPDMPGYEKSIQELNHSIDQLMEKAAEAEARLVPHYEGVWREDNAPFSRGSILPDLFRLDVAGHRREFYEAGRRQNPMGALHQGRSRRQECLRGSQEVRWLHGH